VVVRKNNVQVCQLASEKDTEMASGVGHRGAHGDGEQEVKSLAADLGEPSQCLQSLSHQANALALGERSSEAAVFFL
jgi:hypothetical protein